MAPPVENDIILKDKHGTYKKTIIGFGSQVMSLLMHTLSIIGFKYLNGGSYRDKYWRS